MFVMFLCGFPREAMSMSFGFYDNIMNRWVFNTIVAALEFIDNMSAVREKPLS